MSSTEIFRDTLIRQYEDVQRGTRRLFRLVMPEHLDHAPAAGMMTMRQLIGHMAVIARTAVRGLKSGMWEPPDPVPGDLDRDTAIQILDESVEETITTIRGLSAAEFEKRLVTMPWGPEMTVARAFLALTEHDIHHRTQLYLYLKQLGSEVNSLTLFG